MAQAIFAGGCFWCTEAVFTSIVGVEAVESGYIGGSQSDPTYKQVCSGDTGHAEAIKITFDPAVVSLADLFDIHFATHDPTSLTGKGAISARNTAARCSRLTTPSAPRALRPFLAGTRRTRAPGL